jgi:hypothetical protein
MTQGVQNHKPTKLDFTDFQVKTSYLFNKAIQQQQLYVWLPKQEIKKSIKITFIKH